MALADPPVGTPLRTAAKNAAAAGLVIVSHQSTPTDLPTIPPATPPNATVTITYHVEVRHWDLRDFLKLTGKGVMRCNG